MKKILFVLSLFITLNINAHDIELDGFYYNITSLTDLTVALTCNENNVGEEYGEKYYYGNSYSGDIIVPKEIIWNNRTFVVNEILETAFLNCNLKSLTIPQSVLYMHLGTATIQNLIIEDGEELLHASGYQDYESQDQYGMTHGRIEELYLGRTSPSRLNAGIKKVSFGKYVTEIANQMFAGCDIQGELILPENIVELGGNAFVGNKNITNVTALGLEIMGQQSFSDCSNLTTIDAPNLKYIGSGAFEKCTSLISYEIPKGVATVGAVAFDGCTNLESITIPNSMINLGDVVYYNVTYYQVFRGCTALKSITVNATTPFELEESNFDAQTYINATLHVPSEALETYKNTTVWKNFFNIVGDASSDDNVCSIMINGCTANSWGGHVTIGNKEITNSNYVITSTKGEKITLKFFAHSDEYENYELGTVKVNDENVTAKVVNNELTIEVSENTTIEIEWDYTEADPVYLTIKHADNGCIKMQIDEWETYKFYIEPAEGWSIHTVMLNEEDITSRVGADGELKLYELTENSVLSITFQSNSSAVRAVEQNNAKVYAKEGYISIANIGSGEPIQIYNEAGIQVVSTHATSETMNVPLDKGLYIVKLKDATIKVAM